MPNFTGTLSIISNQSSLDSDLLLMAGIADTAQAMFAATQFLVKIKKLHSGQFIQVTGNKVPNLGIIVMQNAMALSMDEATPSGTESDDVSATEALVNAFNGLNAAEAPGNKKPKNTSGGKASKPAGKKSPNTAKKTDSKKKDK